LKEEYRSRLSQVNFSIFSQKLMLLIMNG